MFRARPGLEALAWARPDRAWAPSLASPSPSLQTGPQAQGLGLGPGPERQPHNLPIDNITRQSGDTHARASGPGLGLEKSEAQALGPLKPWVGPGLAWPGRARLGLA
ncbi:hypothetical protein C8R44DRAFT_736813 [Mycena epipterygia]|nr:hypothetical protein C8R44DRAFT_736813 [Mycena epipterygia]